MSRPIGYYVHHQGAGHLHRARLIADALPRPCALIGTFAEHPGVADVLSLPDDRMFEEFNGLDGAINRPEALHYAPLAHAGVRHRMAAIAAWVAEHNPALMIVDVSVEVSLFLRLLGVPVATVRLAGRRGDQPHLEAFRAAEALLAPFPAIFEGATTPPWIKAKTIYLGFLARSVRGPCTQSIPRTIALVLGRGGDPMGEDLIGAAARATPAWIWEVCGVTTAAIGDRPPNLHLHGWTDEIDPVLDRADIIIGGAGDGLLAAVVATEKHFICLPEARQFDEQVEKANVLAVHGLATVLEHWPIATEWLAILDRAMALDATRLHAFHDPTAIAKAASAIERIASRFDVAPS